MSDNTTLKELSAEYDALKSEKEAEDTLHVLFFAFLLLADVLFIPIISWCHPIEFLEFPAKICGAFKAGFLCDSGNGFFCGSEQPCRLFQTEGNQIRDRSLVNALLKYLKCQTPANMNGCADILQPEILLIMLLNILHHNLETGLVCAVCFSL